MRVEIVEVVIAQFTQYLILFVAVSFVIGTVTRWFRNL